MDKDKLERLEGKIDKITDKLSEINVTLAENTKSLIIHEKRTDLAEKKIDLVEMRLQEQSNKDAEILSKLDQKIQPIQEHVTVVNALVKYGIPAIAALLTFLFKLEIIKFIQ